MWLIWRCILQDPGSSKESRGLKVLRILSYVISGRHTPNLATNLALPWLLYMNGPRSIFLQIDIWSLTSTSFRDFPENVFMKTLQILSLSLYIYIYICFCVLLFLTRSIYTNIYIYIYFFFSATCKKNRQPITFFIRINFASNPRLSYIAVMSLLHYT